MQNTQRHFWSGGQKAVVATEIIAVIFLLCLLAFGKEAKAQSGNVYGYGQAQQASAPVQEAVVLQVAQKTVEASYQTTTTGAAVGGVLGGVLGSRSDQGYRFGGAALGAALGGLVGHKVAQRVGATTAQEIILGLKSKSGDVERVVTIVQPAPYDRVATGQRVLVSNINGAYRVLPQQYVLSQATIE